MDVRGKLDGAALTLTVIFVFNRPFGIGTLSVGKETSASRNLASSFKVYKFDAATGVHLRAPSKMAGKYALLFPGSRDKSSGLLRPWSDSALKRTRMTSSRLKVDKTVQKYTRCRTLLYP